MKVGSIQNGYVIDHITAGRAMQLYSMLKLGALDACVAVISRADSKKMGKKDIIKIDAPVSLDLDVIGYISSSATVNVIVDGQLVEKKNIAPPDMLTNIVKCKNPRCITTTEQEISHIFVKQSDGEYRCLYCDTKIPRHV